MSLGSNFRLNHRNLQNTIAAIRGYPVVRPLFTITVDGWPGFILFIQR
jgi:hypothetical protein